MQKDRKKEMNNTISSTTSGWVHGSLVTSAHPCAMADASPRTHLGQIWGDAVAPQPESKCIRHQIHLPEVHS